MSHLRTVLYAHKGDENELSLNRPVNREAARKLFVRMEDFVSNVCLVYKSPLLSLYLHVVERQLLITSLQSCTAVYLTSILDNTKNHMAVLADNSEQCGSI